MKGLTRFLTAASALVTFVAAFVMPVGAQQVRRICGDTAVQAYGGAQTRELATVATHALWNNCASDLYRGNQWGNFGVAKDKIAMDCAKIKVRPHWNERGRTCSNYVHGMTWLCYVRATPCLD